MRVSVYTAQGVSKVNVKEEEGNGEHGMQCNMGIHCKEGIGCLGQMEAFGPIICHASSVWNTW